MLVTSLLIINKLTLADVSKRTVLNNEYNLEIEGVNWENKIDQIDRKKIKKAKVINKFSLNF